MSLETNESENTFDSHYIYANFSLDELVGIITKISVVYTSLEYVIVEDCMNLSDSSRAIMRQAQADIQILRLKLLDPNTLRVKSESNS